MAMGHLVRPSADQPRSSAQRLIISGVAGILLAAALIAVVLRTSEDSSRAELEAGKLELKGFKSSFKDILGPKGAELSFGDAAFHGAGLNPKAREGGVRPGGLKPSAPINVPKHIAEVGLKAAKGQVLSEVPKDKVDLAFNHPYGKKSSALAFGDAIFNPSTMDPKAKEGGVREGKTPKFSPPLGDLGEVGLAAKPSLPTPKKSSALAFGDSAFHAAANPKAKEGSVRGSKTPDFQPPMGDLGEVGLKAAKKAQTLATKPNPKSLAPGPSALKFGDSSFHPGNSASKREGSIRNGQKPDFEPPLGDLGEVGLKPKIHAGQTLAEAKAAKAKDSKAKGDEDKKAKGKAESKKAEDSDDLEKPDLTFGITTYKDGSPENNYPQEALPKSGEADAKGAEHKLSAKDARKKIASFFEHQGAQTKKAAHSTASQAKKLGSKAESEMHSYFQTLETESKTKAEAALKKKAKEAAEAHKKADSYWKAKSAEDKKAVLMSHPEVEVKGKKDSKPEAKAEMKAVASKDKARLMELSSGEDLKYDKDHFNRHGFHPKKLAHDPEIAKELKEAKSIEKGDLDDCTFTLC